jgi:GTP cyclohydrolase IB
MHVQRRHPIVSSLASLPLNDVQAFLDDRKLPIEAVGIADLRYPLLVKDRSDQAQPTVATVAMDVDLPADVKGTHMSRFVEVLDSRANEVSVNTVVSIARALHDRLGGSRARVAFHFPYFRNRTAPVSGLSALSEHEAVLTGELTNGSTSVLVSVRVPVTSLCPCSKEISDYGAHSQRGYLQIDAQCSPDAPVWLDDLIEVADRCGSAPVYPLLKRVDERHVTMQAYDNPAFVEDIARDAAVALKADDRIQRFEVSVSNQESIHNHSAIARISGERTR